MEEGRKSGDADGETNHGYCSVEGAVVREKDARQTSTQGSTWGKKNPYLLALRMRGSEFCEF